MVFSTHLFLFFFLPIALAGYYALPGRGRTLFLTVVSYVFYGWANPRWMALMAASTALDYYAAAWIVRLGRPAEGAAPPADRPALPEDGPRTRGQRVVLGLSIAANLGLLGWFKYAGFAAENINAISEALGAGPGLVPVLNVALPVGISFYTFQSMSYTIDVYRGRAAPAAGLLEFACFVSLFPQLVAGPIVRYADVADQMRERTHSFGKFAVGVALFSLGLGKKILLANPMGTVADEAFAAGAVGALDAWFGLAAYAFQIYFDFSGYSDMAVGLGMMFGFIFIQNFNDPYSATSLTDFWRRWHISLSTFLRDYLYVPLGGNRRGPARTYLNLMIVMLLGGLWHGAAWNFVIWGGLHGAGLAVERLFRDRGWSLPLPAFARTALTFAFVCLCWVFFRADSPAAALDYIASMFCGAGGAPQAEVVSAIMRTPFKLLTLSLCCAACWGLPLQAWSFAAAPTPARAATALAVFALAVAVMWNQSDNPFLYFRF